MKEFQDMIILVASVFGGLIVLATLYKVFQAYVARRWPTTLGRVVKSEERWKEAEGVDRDGGGAVGNYAFVEYDYEVSGRKCRAHRVDLGQEARNTEVAEVLGRYPVGAVVTVYYNPASPDAAILEHQPLRRFAQGLAGVLAIILCGGVAAFFGIKHLLIFGERILPNARNKDFVIVSGALGLTSILLGLFSLLQTLQERCWPAVFGRVISSKVDISQERVSVSGPMGTGHGASRGSYRPMVTVYRPIVVYRYEADGLQHESSRITAGVAVRASVPGPARKVVERYPAGRAVTVRYNPKDAAQAILETSFGGLYLGLIFGALLLAAAVGLSGYLSSPR